MNINLSKIKNMKQKTKLIIILAIEFVAIITILLLIFFAGKKTHTVTFDLNGGILLSGDVEQRVTQGQSATPPSVAKYGHYLRGWSGSYRSVTRDVTVKAIWEYETSPGIEYYFPEHTNYCEISGSFSEIQGEVYIGAYYNDRQVLGIQAGAFKDRTGITAVHLLDGILAIEDEAFMGCVNLESIEIPSTVVRIGEDAFKNCKNLKEIILPDSLHTIESGAFSGCESLEKIVFNNKLVTIGERAFSGCAALGEAELPESLRTVGSLAFSDCPALKDVILSRGVEKIGLLAFNTDGMTVRLYISEEEIPDGFINGWYGEGVTLEFGYLPPIEDETEDGQSDGNGKKDDENDGFWGGIK